MSTEEVPSMDLRRLLAGKARYKDSRITQFSTDMPTDWSPSTVNNPKSNMVFSDASAWDLIADLLENSACAARFDILKKPEGIKAVVILHRLEEKRPLLYIKVHLGAKNKIMGRSFHYSYMEETE